MLNTQLACRTGPISPLLTSSFRSWKAGCRLCRCLQRYAIGLALGHWFFKQDMDAPAQQWLSDLPVKRRWHQDMGHVAPACCQQAFNAVEGGSKAPLRGERSSLTNCRVDDGYRVRAGPQATNCLRVHIGDVTGSDENSPKVSHHALISAASLSSSDQDQREGWAEGVCNPASSCSALCRSVNAS
jgi:hypothetical protein